jgi:hypothetical protein
MGIADLDDLGKVRKFVTPRNQSRLSAGGFPSLRFGEEKLHENAEDKKKKTFYEVVNFGILAKEGLFGELKTPSLLGSEGVAY